ncbi:uncharacterized protein LOC110854171 [Folsomia candida]|uniref:uncharacterized protein LOC110854171 n=1 Tax=Folsomia candida TaxID=158441 RepID=UPI000B90189B|nr:uncharacterized protein LOC110854171 [Folsomia candida]
MSNGGGSETPPPAYSQVAQLNQLPPQRRQAPQVDELISQHRHHVFSILLVKDNQLHLIDCPPGYYELVSEAIQEYWGAIKTTTFANNGTIKFVLQEIDAFGPWSALRRTDQSIRSRRVIGGIMQRLARHGWGLLQTCEISMKENGKDTLFFEDSLIDREARIFAISFSRTDRLRLISAPIGFITIVRDVISSVWKRGIQSSKNLCSGTHEFKLYGFPWVTSGIGMEKCKLFTKLCTEMRNHGYKFHASVKLTQKYKEMPTWYFRKVTRVYS